MHQGKAGCKALGGTGGEVGKGGWNSILELCRILSPPNLFPPSFSSCKAVADSLRVLPIPNTLFPFIFRRNEHGLQKTSLSFCTFVRSVCSRVHPKNSAWSIASWLGHVSPSFTFGNKMTSDIGSGCSQPSPEKETQ